MAEWTVAGVAVAEGRCGLQRIQAGRESMVRVGCGVGACEREAWWSGRWRVLEWKVAGMGVVGGRYGLQRWWVCVAWVAGMCCEGGRWRVGGRPWLRAWEEATGEASEYTSVRFVPPACPHAARGNPIGGVAKRYRVGPCTPRFGHFFVRTSFEDPSRRKRIPEPSYPSLTGRGGGSLRFLG